MGIARLDEIDLLALEPTEQPVDCWRHHDPYFIDAGLREVALVGGELQLRFLGVTAEGEGPAADRLVDAQTAWIVADALLGHDVLPDVLGQDDVELEEIALELSVRLLEDGAQDAVRLVLDGGAREELVGGPEDAALPLQHEVEGELQILDAHRLAVVEGHARAQLEVPGAIVDAVPRFDGPGNDLEIGIEIGKSVVDQAT